MNSTTNSIAGSVTRHAMTGGGVAGLVSAQDDILRFVSLIVTIIGLGWSIWEKVRRPGQGTTGPRDNGPGAVCGLVVCGLVVLSTGCARFILPTPAQLRAISTDTNSIHIKIVSVYGTLEMDRNNPPGNGVTLTPSTTLQLTPTQ